MLTIGGVILALALVVGGLAMYRPPRASYMAVTPEPIGKPAAAPQGVGATSDSGKEAPTAAASADTITLGDRAVIVAASVFPAQSQIAQGTPIILSFSAQGGEMQQLCVTVGGLLDSGLCSIRSLSVGAVDDAGVHVPLTADQAQTLTRVRDAGVALIVAADNAVLMATTTTKQPTAAPTIAPPPTAAAAPTTAPAAASPAPQAQKQAAATFVDGLPLLWVAVGMVVLAIAAGAVVVLRRRRGGPAPLKGPKPATGQKFGLPKLGGGKAPTTNTAPAPVGLSLNLGSIEVQPLLDDDTAIAQSAPRAIEESFTSAAATGPFAPTAPSTGAFLSADDDLFAPDVTAPSVATPAPTVFGESGRGAGKPIGDDLFGFDGGMVQPAAPAVAGASATSGTATGAFLSADDDLFASDFALPPAAGSDTPDMFGGGTGAFLNTDNDLFASDFALAPPTRPSAVDDVFSTPPSAATGAGLLEDLQPEPVVAVAEPVIPRLGAPLPPARAADALPPTAALDRQSALRWVKRSSDQ
jgi:hypothetical protein